MCVYMYVYTLHLCLHVMSIVHNNVLEHVYLCVGVCVCRQSCWKVSTTIGKWKLWRMSTANGECITEKNSWEKHFRYLSTNSNDLPAFLSVCLSVSLPPSLSLSFSISLKQRQGGCKPDPLLADLLERAHGVSVCCACALGVTAVINEMFLLYPTKTF